MTASEALLRVLYDPAAWADAAWFERFGVDVRWPQRLANRVLLRHAPISGMRLDACTCARSKWLVENWDELPALVYLVGARLARDAIASRNGLLSLRWRGAHFVALPFYAPSGDARSFRTIGWHETDLDIHDLALARGTACLRDAMLGTAPGWKDRVRLRLPPSPLVDGNSDPVHSHESGGAQPNRRLEQIASLHLLKFAASFHHAQKY